MARHLNIALLKDWKVSILPLPKRQSGARAFGFCAGFAVGYSERGEAITPHWWLQGLPQKIPFPANKFIELGSGHGDEIPGRLYTNSRSEAVVWRLGTDGSLDLRTLDPAHYKKTWAVGSAVGAIAGYGIAKLAKGEFTDERPLLWRPDGTLIELPTGRHTRGICRATDGDWAVGYLGHTGMEAVLWSADGSQMIELNPTAALSSQFGTLAWPGRGVRWSEMQPPLAVGGAEGVGDGEQVGSIMINENWNWNRTLAALWRGSAESFVDLTPDAFTKAEARDCAAGLQVGSGSNNYQWSSDVASDLSHALLWAGSAERYLDLHKLLPEMWNESYASAIEVDENHVRIVGTVIRTELERSRNLNEYTVLAAQQPVIWEAKIGN